MEQPTREFLVPGMTVVRPAGLPAGEAAPGLPLAVLGQGGPLAPWLVISAAWWQAGRWQQRAIGRDRQGWQR